MIIDFPFHIQAKLLTDIEDFTINCLKHGTHGDIRTFSHLGDELDGIALDGLTAIPLWQFNEQWHIVGYHIPKLGKTLGKHGIMATRLHTPSNPIITTTTAQRFKQLTSLGYQSVVLLNDDYNELARHTPPNIAIIDDPSHLNDKGAIDEAIKQEMNALQYETWQAIEPLDRPSAKDNPYPIDAWHGILKHAIHAISEHAQVDFAMASHWILGALSHIAQGKVNAPMGYSQKPCSLFLLLQAESGDGKSYSKDLALFAIENHQRQQQEQYRRELDYYHTTKSQLKGKELKNFLMENIEPRNPATLFDNATIEPLLEKMICDNTPHLSYITDEASTFFNGYSLKSDTALANLGNLTTLWSNGTATRLRTRKNDNPHTHAFNARLTLCLAAQRTVLERVLNDSTMNEQGFLPRMLFSNPPSTAGKRDFIHNNGNAYDDPRLTAFWQRCIELLAIDDKIEYTLTAPLQHSLATSQQAIENQIGKGKALESYKAHANRMCENAIRIATLIAYFDHAREITTDHFTSGLSLVHYHMAEFINYHDRQENEKPSNAELLLKYIVDKGQSEIGWSTLKSKVTPKALRDKDLFSEAVNILAEKNYIRISTERPIKITLNPALTP